MAYNAYCFDQINGQTFYKFCQTAIVWDIYHSSYFAAKPRKHYLKPLMRADCVSVQNMWTVLISARTRPNIPGRPWATSELPWRFRQEWETSPTSFTPAAAGGGLRQTGVVGVPRYPLFVPATRPSVLRPRPCLFVPEVHHVATFDRQYRWLAWEDLLLIKYIERVDHAGAQSLAKGIQNYDFTLNLRKCITCFRYLTWWRIRFFRCPRLHMQRYSFLMGYWSEAQVWLVCCHVI
jgi:hypothetical protein